MSRAEFKGDVRVDPEALDVECVRQAEIFTKWAELAQDAKSRMEALKFDLDTKWALLELKVRKRPGKYGLETLTEAAVKATVSTHPEYLELARRHQGAREESMWLDRAVAALEMKKRMLEELIKLHGLQYFAGPSAPRNLGSEWNSRQAARDRRANKKVNLRKRGP